MRLELATFPVEQIRLGNRFAYEQRAFEVDKSALLNLALEDRRITDASLAVARPAESLRITGIRDIVEPRCKVGDSSDVFPGVMGPVANVGAGRTHRLSGMTVIAAAAYEGTIRAGTTVQRSALLDMSAAGAEISRFSKHAHLIVSFRVADGLGELDAHHAIQQAELKVAKRIAEVTKPLSPDQLIIYELSERNPELPTVMLYQIA